MVGETFDIYPSKMPENTPNHPPWLEKILKTSTVECLEMGKFHHFLKNGIKT